MEGWLGIIFEAELDNPSGWLIGNKADNVERQIDNCSVSQKLSGFQHSNGWGSKWHSRSGGKVDYMVTTSVSLLLPNY